MPRDAKCRGNRDDCAGDIHGSLWRPGDDIFTVKVLEEVLPEEDEMTSGKGKEDYYRGEDWTAKGDAFALGKAPHLSDRYKCPCGSDVAIACVLRDMGECMEVLTECRRCKLFHALLVDKRHYGGHKK